MNDKERALEYMKLAEDTTRGEWEATARHELDFTITATNGAVQTLIPFHIGDAQFIAASHTEGVWAAKRLIEALELLEEIKTMRPPSNIIYRRIQEFLSSESLSTTP